MKKKTVISILILALTLVLAGLSLTFGWMWYESRKRCERIEDRANLPELYGALGEAYRKLDTWSMYVITAYDQAESGIGLRSSKNRKIYNGMMKTYLYEYIGPKPPRKPREGRT